jgi:membrane-associated phospholipid phosphatase
MVGIARVAMGVHYVSDVVAGAALGIVAAIIGLQIHEPLLIWVSKMLGLPLW